MAVSPQERNALPQDSIDGDDAFEALILYVQETRGVDFRGYKRSSLSRRIGLRMAQVDAADYAAYQSLLEAEPQEFKALLDTVLINVTAFFRDPDAWAVLRDEVIPRLLQQGGGRDPIRIWSIGCATGEEPYTVAMLFAEALGMGEFARRVKIYATDLDEAALRQARQATYARRDAEAVPPSLVERYFETTGDRVMLSRDLRKAVIFGEHNVVTSAPISRIDLVICRNLLIYLDNETQEAVLPRLHYALSDDGFLFLGRAETQLLRSRLFTAFELKHRIFRKQPNEGRRIAAGVSFGPGGTAAATAVRLLEAVVDATTTAYLAVDGAGVLIFANQAAREMLDVGKGDIGRPFQDLEISYRPAELRGRIEEVGRTGRTTRLDHQEFDRPPLAKPTRLTIELTPLGGSEEGPVATLLAFTDTTLLFDLKRELDVAQASLQSTVEELQSSNEELETTNEELQSTNEELETTNEELQSTNEELETTNEELRSTNDELEITNQDLQRETERAQEYQANADAVLTSIDCGVIVLDALLEVRSWNRWCETVWGLRAGEVVGRPLVELEIGLPTDAAIAAARQVLAREPSQADIVLDSVDRRGRALRCRLRVVPLFRREQGVRGVVVIIDDAGAGPPV